MTCFGHVYLGGDPWGIPGLSSGCWRDYVLWLSRERLVIPGSSGQGAEALGMSAYTAAPASISITDRTIYFSWI